MQDLKQNATNGTSDILVPDAYLTKVEMAGRLRKTTRTIDDWMAKGILPYMKIGRSVLFDWEDCQHHLNEYFRVSRFSPRPNKKDFSHE